MGDSMDQRWIAIKIGKTLTKVDGAVFKRQARHDREDGGANIWQARYDSRCRVFRRARLGDFSHVMWLRRCGDLTWRG